MSHLSGQKVAQQGMTVLGQDAFGVKLHPFNRQAGVTDAHDFAVVAPRRDAQLDVSDRIVLTLGVDEATKAQVATHEGLIAGETLAVSVVWDTAVERTIAIEGTLINVSVAAQR